MIQIKDKKRCCGCSACVQRCPKQCISMRRDNEGFLYPIVDTTLCVNCGLCEKVCPIINENEPRKPLKSYAAYSKDEGIRAQSSSGGIFTLLAEETIKKGGVVFGVKFNKEWMPIFSYAETSEGIAPFRGSKYVQAIVGNAYKEAEIFLKAGRKVLFTGTPCQIAGLKNYLHKEYDNLLTVDIICHGVPSPKVWDMYLKETCSRLIDAMPDGKNSVVSATGGEYKSCIEAISFRSKITGWKKYSFQLKLNFSTSDGKKTVVFSETLDKNAFMRVFLCDAILRPSCYSCPAKQGKSHSDITIADLWGINNIDSTFDNNKGTSAVLLNTEEGVTIYKNLDIKELDIKYEQAILGNPAFEHSAKEPINRGLFWDRYKGNNLVLLSKEFRNRKPSIIKRLINRIKLILKT